MRFSGLVCVLFSLIVASYAARLIKVENPIPNGKYIVVMKEGTTIVQRDYFLDEVRSHMLQDFSNSSEITDVFRINRMVGFFAYLSSEMLQYHLSHPMVRYVEPDQMMSINYEVDKVSPIPSVSDDIITQTGSTWGLARISRQAATGTYNYIYGDAAGEDVEIYVIDTGVYPENVEFGGRASSVFSAISGESPDDLNGHGSHCAGTAGGKTYGVAKKATIYGVKVLSKSGSGTNTGVISGIEYVTANHGKKAVANMSLGGGKSTVLNLAVAESIASGVAYAVAAGNENQNACNVSPASTPQAVTVGSITSTNVRSSFSNWGTCVDVFAPGSSILSAWIGSPTATNTISGTSMASPHVCGFLAIQLSLNAGFDSTELSNYVAEVATPGQLTDPGTGSPNLIAFSPYTSQSI